MASAGNGAPQTATTGRQQQEAGPLPLQAEEASNNSTDDAAAAATAAAAAAKAVRTAAADDDAADDAASPAMADTPPHGLVNASNVYHDAATMMDQAETDEVPSAATGGDTANTSTTTTTTTTAATTTTSAGSGSGSGSIETVAGSPKGTLEKRVSGTDDSTSSAPRFVRSRLAKNERTEMAAVPSAAPALPPHYVERSALLRRAIDALTSKVFYFGWLAGPHGHHLQVLLGASGSGKTVLASSIVRHPEIRKAFWRGIFWVRTKVGRGGSCGTNSGRFLGLLRGLVEEIQGADSDPASATHGEKGGDSNDGGGGGGSGGGGGRDSDADGGGDGDNRRSRASTAPVTSGEPRRPRRLACVEEAILRLADANARASRRLLVLDDVCDAGVVSELQRAGFVVLVTTTIAGALSLERAIDADRRAIKIEVTNDMTRRQALTLLRRRQGEEGDGMELRDAADDITGAPAGSNLLEVAELWCGLFPLALAVVDASGDAPPNTGGHQPEPWRETAEVQQLGGQQQQQQQQQQQVLDGSFDGVAGVSVAQQLDPASRYMRLGWQQEQQIFDSSFNSVVAVSLTQLDPASRDSFVRLGVLAEGAVVPKDMLSSLWEQSLRETDETLKKLVDRSFLEEALPGSESYLVHGPILSFARAKLFRDCTTATRETIVHLQASYLGRVDVLLRFSDGGGGAALRGCSELGGLVALSALWQSVESLRVTCGGDGGDGGGGGGGGGKGSARLLLCMTYERALKPMGLCAVAACGYWAAAKLLQLQDDPDGAIEMGSESVRIGNELYQARAERSHSLCMEAALIRACRDDNDDDDQAALRPRERWLQSTRSVLGADHPAVAAALNSLAGVLVEQGKLAEAEGRYREALGVLEDALGDEHPQLAMALIDIAEVASAIAAEEEAQWKRQEVKRKKTSLLGEVGRSTPPPSPPAEVLPGASRASGICERALAIFDGDLAGRFSRGKATLLVRLAKIMATQGKDKLKEAERLIWRALADLRSGFEPYPLQAATILVDLAGVLVLQGKRKQAIKLYRQAITEGESCLDSKHEKLASWRNELGRLFVSQGKHVEAAAQYLRIIENCVGARTVDVPCVVETARLELMNVVMLADQDALLVRMISLTEGDDAKKGSLARKGETTREEATKKTDEDTPPAKDDDDDDDNDGGGDDDAMSVIRDEERNEKEGKDDDDHHHHQQQHQHQQHQQQQQQDGKEDGKEDDEGDDEDTPSTNDDNDHDAMSVIRDEGRNEKEDRDDYHQYQQQQQQQDRKEDDDGDGDEDEEEEEEEEEMGEEELDSLKAAALYLDANDPQLSMDLT